MSKVKGQMSNVQSKSRGFTLIELLIVIGIVVVLTGLVVVAINPGERLAEARDNRRQADVDTIYSIVEQYVLQNHGKLPGSDGNCFDGKEDGENFDFHECGPYLAPIYVSEMPRDPLKDNGGETGYLVKRDSKGRIGVEAYHYEGNERITAGSWPQYCLKFNGEDDYIEFDDVSLSGDKYTFSFWTDNQYHTDESRNAVLEIRNGDRLIIAKQYGNIPRFAVYDGGSWRAFSTDHYPQSETPEHITIVVDDDEVTLYTNGEEKETIAITQYSTLEGRFFIGSYIGGSSNFLKGKLDDVRIYDRALSESEIEDLYNGKNITGGLVGHWTMNEGEECIAYDFSENENDGSLEPDCPTDAPDWIRDCK